MSIVYRATRRAQGFAPLDAAASVARNGWRWNDRDTPILYAASVQSLALLEVVARPGWEAVQVVTVYPIGVPAGSLLTLSALGLHLPTNWNNRPAANAARAVGAQFLRAVDAAAAQGMTICGLLVPSVISSVDANVLLDPRQTARYTVGTPASIPFDWLASTST